MNVFIALLSVLLTFLSTFVASAAPKCVRPQDYSQSKAVREFESCFELLTKFCASHTSDPACTALSKISDKPKVSSKDAKPADRCTIAKDGSYVCDQDPVRLLAVGNDIAVAPASPATSPAPSPGASSATANTPGGGNPFSAIEAPPATAPQPETPTAPAGPPK